MPGSHGPRPSRHPQAEPPGHGVVHHHDGHGTATGREPHRRAPVVSFAKGMGLHEGDAEDAAQETMDAFVQAIQAGQYDRDKGRLSSWLFGFARNTILSSQRRNQNRKDRQSADTGYWRRLPDDEAVECAWDRAWEEEVADACLKQLEAELDEKHFAAFKRIALDGEASKAVAFELGISDSTARVVKFRALKRLAELRAQYDATD